MVLGWLGAIVLTDRLRADRLDTWTGPGATVQSGMHLDGCPVPDFAEGRDFPGWVRYGGRVYVWIGRVLPMGTASVPSLYQPTDYELGDLVIYRISSTEAGRNGDEILIRKDVGDAGAVYAANDACR